MNPIYLIIEGQFMSLIIIGIYSLIMYQRVTIFNYLMSLVSYMLSFITKGILELKIQLLKIVCPINLGQSVMSITLFVSYSILLSYLLNNSVSINVAYCVGPPSTEEIQNNTAQIVSHVQKEANKIYEIFHGIFLRLPDNTTIDLQEAGCFKFKTSFTKLTAHFPLNKLSDYALVLPDKFRDTSLGTLFMQATKNPTIHNVSEAGTYLNMIYSSVLTTLTKPGVSLPAFGAAWHQMEIYLPVFFEFQIVQVNDFLDIICYPYRVEDFYEGSAYARCNMKYHEYMQSFYDPFAADYIQSEARRYIIMKENEFKQLFYEQMISENAAFDIHFWTDKGKPEIPDEPFHNPFAKPKPVSPEETKKISETNTVNTKQTEINDINPLVSEQHIAAAEEPIKKAINEDKKKTLKENMPSKLHFIKDEVERFQYNCKHQKYYGLTLGTILGSSVIAGAALGVSIGYIRYKYGF